MISDKLSNIKNVIFDLGGVVIDLDRNRAVKALSDLGLQNADSLLGLYKQEEPFLGIETGTRSVAEFFDLLRSIMIPGVSDLQITAAFNQFLVDLPVKRLEMLRRMRKAGFRIFMLSNTNPVMYLTWIDKAFRQEGLTVNDYFDGIVVSFQELTCKPDVKIFSNLLDRYSLNPNETMMLDDSVKNCEAAAMAGILPFNVGKDESNDMVYICNELLKTRNTSI